MSPNKRRVFDYEPGQYWEQRALTYKDYESLLGESGKTARHLEVLLSAFRREKPRSVLEIGCGSGRISRVIAPLVEEFTAIDISKSMVEHTLMSLAGSDRASLALATAWNLPFKSRSFDTVVACEVLLHVVPANIPRTISEIARVAPAAVILDFYSRRFRNPKVFRQVVETLDSHNFLHDYPRIFEAAGLRVVTSRELRGLSQTCFLIDTRSRTLPRRSSWRASP